MSLTTTQSLFQYAIAALGQAFSPACEVQNTSDFVVTYTNPTTFVDTLLTLNVDYTVTGAATNGKILAPTVTLEASGIHYAVAGTLTIQRKPPLTQPTTFQDGVKYLAAVQNNSLDWLAYAIQELNDIALRSLRIPATNTALAELTLPARAGKILAFDASGNPTFLPIAAASATDLSAGYVFATSTVTQRTLADRFAEVVNVKDFGATGLGTVDDTLKIQAAFDFAKARTAADSLPRVVYFPAGKYLCTATLVLGTTGSPVGSVAIMGAGARQSVITRTTDYGNTLNVVGNYSGGNNVQGMGFIATNTVTNGCHLLTQQLSSSVVADIWMLDGFIGLKLIGCYDMIYDRIRIWGGSNLTGTNVAGSYYLHIAANALPANPNFDCLFSNFLFRHSGTEKKTSVGIQLDHTDGVWFDNGHVIGANFAMIISPANTFTVQNIQCLQVFLDGNCQAHLQITGSGRVAAIRFQCCIFGGAEATAGADGMIANCALLDGLIFHACEWGSNQGSILNLTSGTNCEILGCKIKDNDLGSIANLITIAAGFTRTRIMGNTFGTQPANYAIFVNGGTNLTITGNDFQQGSGPDDIFLNAVGAATQIANNTTDRSNSVAAAAALPLKNVGDFFIITGATGITSLPVTVPGRKVTLQFSGAPTLTNGANLKLAGAANFNATADDLLTLQTSDGTVWREVGRSVN